MTQMVSIPVAEKPARKARSLKTQAKSRIKPDLNFVEARQQACELAPTASRMLRRSYRLGSFGDPL